MVEGYRYMVYLMHQVGRHREAIELLRTGCWQQARIAFRAGRLWTGLYWGLRAARAEAQLHLTARARG
jgi:hypothetical protein